MERIASSCVAYKHVKYVGAEDKSLSFALICMAERVTSVCIWDILYLHTLSLNGSLCLHSPLFFTFYIWCFHCWLIQRLSFILTKHQYIRTFNPPSHTQMSVSAFFKYENFVRSCFTFNECSLTAGSTCWLSSQSRSLPSKILWSTFPKTCNDGSPLFFPGPFRLSFSLFIEYTISIFHSDGGAFGFPVLLTFWRRIFFSNFSTPCI